MERIKENNLVVIVGSWNPHILLNPEWLKKYILPDQEKFHMSIEFGHNLAGLPSVATEDMKISLIGGRLSLTPINDNVETFIKIEDAITKLSDFLPHTPIVSFGVNFLYRENKNNYKFINKGTTLFDFLESDIAKIETENTRYTLHHNNSILNLGISESTQDDSNAVISLDFNFDHPVADFTTLKEVIEENPIADYLAFSQKIAEETFAKI